VYFRSQLPFPKLANPLLSINNNTNFATGTPKQQFTASYVPVSMLQKNITGIIDSGSFYSIVKASLIPREVDIEPPPVRSLGTANGSTLLITGVVTISIVICGIDMTATLLMSPNFPHDLILGNDFLSECGAIIDYSTKTVRFGEKSATFHFSLPFSDVANIVCAPNTLYSS